MNANESTTPDMGWEAQIDAVAIKTDLNEIKSWINDGKLMPGHKVRMKNLTWIEAGQVPAFQKLFEQRANAPVAQNTKATVNVSQTGRLNNPVPSSVFTDNISSTNVSSTPELKLEPAEPSLTFKLYEQKLVAKSQSAETPTEKAAERPKRTSPKPQADEKKAIKSAKPARNASFRSLSAHFSLYFADCSLPGFS